MQRIKLQGRLEMAKRGKFTPEGKTTEIEYWTIRLFETDGRTIQFPFHFQLGEQIFGNAGSLEAIMNKLVEVTAEVSQFEHVIKIKGVDIHELKDPK